MKKILPSVLMLILCTAVLAVGVFAFTPISNSISGTINISAGKGSFAITGYVDDVVVYPRKEVHTNVDLVIDSSSLNFDASHYCFPEEVPEKEIKLVIENLTDTALGVFFCDTANVNATESNIVTNAEVKSSTDASKTILNAELDFYKYIAPANEENTFDQVEMLITLSVASLSGSTQSGTFNFNLNIEEYDSELNATEKFVKLPDTETVTGECMFESNFVVESVVIPSSYTTISEATFNYACGLKHVSIPNSVTFVDAMGFFCCCSLTRLTVPALTDGGDFTWCRALKKVKILGGVVGMFSECESLEEVILCDGVTALGYGAFEYCTSLKKVAIPYGVTIIGNHAFYGCSSLKEIIIPNSVSEIRSLVFSGCSSLKEITIPSSVTKIGYGAFHSCRSLTQIILPNSVDEIPNAMFLGCSSLTELTIPSSVNTIRFQAFDGCVSLTKITVEAHNTSGNFDSTASGASPAYLPVVSGTAWYIDGGTEVQTKLSYSTSTLVFVRKYV